jgi:protein-disulfide isomerase
LLAATIEAGQTVKSFNQESVRQEILQYVKDRFSIPANVTLTVTPFLSSAIPGFYQTTVLVNGGKSKQLAFVSADGKLLIFGNIYHLPSDPPSVAERRTVIVNFVRQQFKVPANLTLGLMPFRDSQFPQYYRTTVVVNGGQQQQVAYVSKDGQYLVFGNIFQLGSNPQLTVEREINLHDQAGVGPANAPVTIVEFSDLECPMCARMHQFMVSQLIPKYGNKIHIVFKEFPLVQIHQWALTGAIADQCVYEMNPADVLRFRTLVFQDQSLLNATNARALLLDFGQRLGLDRLRLAACIDSKATLPRVEASMREGQRLGVNSTPTLFINGQMMVGLPPADQVFAVINHDLAAR